jgi:hypothetical protein
MDFKSLMNTGEYDFLRTHERLGKRIMLLGIGGSYAYGTEVTIEARAFGGYRFLGWNDGVMDEQRTVMVTENASYTALFEQNTGIEDVENASYKVYVSNGHIVVEGVENKRVQVYDLTGRKHSLGEQLPTGVYLVRIDNVITKKVVVL